MKPNNAKIYDWNQFWGQFEKFCQLKGIDTHRANLDLLWDSWKEGYKAGVESTTGDKE